MPEVEWSDEFVPGGRAVRRRRALAGGFASPVWLCELDDGQEVVVKASSHDSAALFAAEAEGLETLSELGGLRTPRVIAVGPRSIVLEALVRIGRRALKGPAHVVIAAIAFVAIFFLAAPFPLIILLAGFTGWLGHRLAPALFRPAVRAAAGDLPRYRARRSAGRRGIGAGGDMPPA